MLDQVCRSRCVSIPHEAWISTHQTCRVLSPRAERCKWQNPHKDGSTVDDPTPHCVARHLWHGEDRAVHAVDGVDDVVRLVQDDNGVLEGNAQAFSGRPVQQHVVRHGDHLTRKRRPVHRANNRAHKNTQKHTPTHTNTHKYTNAHKRAQTRTNAHKRAHTQSSAIGAVKATLQTTDRATGSGCRKRRDNGGGGGRGEQQWGFRVGACHHRPLPLALTAQHTPLRPPRPCARHSTDRRREPCRVPPAPRYPLLLTATDTRQCHKRR